MQGMLWGVTAVGGKKGGRIVQRGEFSCSSVSTETSAMPTRRETGDPADLSCFGTGGLGLYTLEVSIRHWVVGTGEVDVTLGEAEITENGKDVTSHILQRYQNYSFSFFPFRGVGLTFCLLWKHEDWAILFPSKTEQFLDLGIMADGSTIH